MREIETTATGRAHLLKIRRAIGRHLVNEARYDELLGALLQVPNDEFRQLVLAMLDDFN